MLTGGWRFADHRLARLVEAYRAHGHKAAKINPLQPEQPVAASVPEINMLTGTMTGRLQTAGTRQLGGLCAQSTGGRRAEC